MQFQRRQEQADGWFAQDMQSNALLRDARSTTRRHLSHVYDYDLIFPGRGFLTRPPRHFPQARLHEFGIQSIPNSSGLNELKNGERVRKHPPSPQHAVRPLSRGAVSRDTSMVR